jgi:hypothetical protein
MFIAFDSFRLEVGSYWIHRHIAIGSKFILAVVMQSPRPEGMTSIAARWRIPNVECTQL